VRLNTVEGRRLNNEKLYVKIEKNNMGGACGTYGGLERCTLIFGREN
jgi:hypothetical protein